MLLTRTGAEKADKPSAIHAYGLARCEAIWLCPVCAFTIRARHARQVEAALRAANSRGWGAAFGILTVPHAAEPLPVVWDRLSSLWAILNDGKGASGWSGRFRAQHGILGFLWFDEVTWSFAAGWHPHRHLVIVTDRRCTKPVAAEIGAIIQGRAAEWAVRVGHDAPTSEASRFAPVDVRRAGRLAAYLAGATHLKTGARPRPFAGTTGAPGSAPGEVGGLTPFDLLAAITDADHPAARLWAEYEAATHGRPSHRWGTGLISQLRRPLPSAYDRPPSRRTTEDAEVDGALWAELVSPFPGREARLRRAMATDGAAGVEDLLDAWREHLDAREDR